MGENLDIDGRLSVRSPMQWSEGPNAGFSTADPSHLCRPLVEGPFGPHAVNVADQRRDPESLLNWMEQIIRRRRETPEFGWGKMTILATGESTVLAHRCDWEGRTVLAVHNFGVENQTATIEIDGVPAGGEAPQLEDLLTLRSGPSLENGRADIEIDGFGHRWFRLTTDPHRG